MKNHNLYMTCLGHNVEVSLDLPENCRKTYDHIPCTVVNEFLEAVECGVRKGTFANVPDDEMSTIGEGYSLSGSWRIVSFDYGILSRVMMWWNNDYCAEEFDRELFIRYFGQEAGCEYHDRWVNQCKENLLDMFGTFVSDYEAGQLFCNMIMEQVEQYENNESQTKKNHEKE